MTSIRRYSPVSFEHKALQTDQRAGWEIVLEYEDEGDGPYLVDMSHIAKWDIQAERLAQLMAEGIRIPEAAGACIYEKRVLISRMNETQAVVCHLFGNDAILPDDSAYTDITEAFALLALLGKDVFSMMEKMSALDLQPPRTAPPFFVQGPILHVPSRITVLANDALLIAFSRGYAHSMVKAILEAGSEWNLKPAGELKFKEYLKKPERF
jgi:glycine cleavage system aminomethyltransferase T